MNLLVYVIPLCAFIITQVCSQDIFSTELSRCNVHENIIRDYQNTIYKFTVQLYQKIDPKAINSNFVFSPLSAWTIFGAIAEGTDPVTKEFMFKYLNLHDDPCIRLKYYQLATSRFISSDDINITNTRVLVIDETVDMNPIYHNFVYKNSLLDVVSAPMRSDPRTALEEIRRVTSAQVTNLDLSGNSVILDAVDYNGLWTTAFEDAVIERSPFYSTTGEQIGTVDLMKIKRRARITHFEPLNIKGLDLPVGHNGRYRMMFGLILESTTAAKTISHISDKIIDEFLSSLKETYEPIEIAIPRFSITSEYDLRMMLEKYGVKSFWSDPTVTGYISNPPALPNGYIQRSSITIDPAGLQPAPFSDKPFNISMGSLPEYKQSFIANKPFFMSIFDTETYSCIMAATFINPTYST